MANKKNLLGMLVMVLVFWLLLTGCGDPTKNDEDGKNGKDDDKIPKNAIELTANIWSDGAVTDGGDQWFKFTATASTQYLHISFGTVNSIYVQLHNNTGNALGNAILLRDSTKNTSWMLTNGQTYYVKVTSGSGYGYSTTGTYRIAFNTMQFLPGTFDQAADLTADVWSDGSILSGEEQWFKFTATASIQYLHVSFGTMDSINVQLHTNTGNALGNAILLRDSTKNTSWTVTNGQEYYVKVTSGSGYGYSTTGTYRIAFNTMQFPPDGAFDQAADLIANVWSDGSILSGEEQWFKFTATASIQYLHVSFGTMDSINVQLHTNTGNALGSAILLRDSTKSTSLMLTNRQEYYVKVTSGSGYGYSTTGTFQIAFNTSTTAPN